jgi:transposase
MRRTRRSFSREYRFEAAHRVIDEKRRVADVARELDVHKSLLQTWVRDERWRMAEAAARGRPDSSGGQSLSLDERAELTRLRAQVVEQAEAIALLEKAAAYFSAQRNRPECRAHFGSSEKCHDTEQEQHQDQSQDGPTGR